MDRITLYKTMPQITFAEIAAEIKWRYRDLNWKTAAEKFIDLMKIVNKAVHSQKGKDKTVVKILMASLISDVFISAKRN